MRNISGPLSFVQVHPYTVEIIKIATQTETAAGSLECLGFDRNPIASVRQTAKRRCEPEVLTIDELRALLSELEGIYRTMVYTAGVTGCRVSEVAGLR